MKTKYLSSLFLGLILFTCFSCVLIDLEDMPDPTPPATTGKVTLIVDWSNRTEGIEIPTSYIVEINNQILTFAQSANLLPQLDAGTYPLLSYNSADKITKNGMTATVQTENNTVDNQPGWLFTSALDAIYESGKDKTVTAIMNQQIRQLTIELTITNGDPERIVSTEALFNGVANNLNIPTNVVTGKGLHVIPVFTRQDNKLTAIVRLLGVTEDQKLILSFTFSDGKEQKIETDLTAKLAGFNSEKHKPMILTANLSLPSETGFEATITGWEAKTENDGIAW